MCIDLARSPGFVFNELRGVLAEHVSICERKWRVASGWRLEETGQRFPPVKFRARRWGRAEFSLTPNAAALATELSFARSYTDLR